MMGEEKSITKGGVPLMRGPNDKREAGRVHDELHAPCGCAFHERPAPHWHQCPTHATRPVSISAAVARRPDAEKWALWAFIGACKDSGLRNDKLLEAMSDVVNGRGYTDG